MVYSVKSDTPVSANGIVVSIACSKVIWVSIMAYLIPYADTKLVPGGPAGPCIPRGPWIPCSPFGI